MRDKKTGKQREKKGAMTLNVREKWREKGLKVRKVFNEREKKDRKRWRS